MWFSNFLTAAISGFIFGLSYKKRPEIGKTASNRARTAAILMMVNSVVIAGASQFANEMADDWTELKQHVPEAWMFAQNLLEAASAFLYPAALLLLASAVFAPRAVEADPSVARVPDAAGAGGNSKDDGEASGT